MWFYYITGCVIMLTISNEMFSCSAAGNATVRTSHEYYENTWGLNATRPTMHSTRCSTVLVHANLSTVLTLCAMHQQHWTKSGWVAEFSRWPSYLVSALLHSVPWRVHKAFVNLYTFSLKYLSVSSVYKEFIRA